MARVHLPSVQLDAVAEDFLDATQGSCLAANAEPYALSDGNTLIVEVDGGAPQTVTFNTVDFDDITKARADEVVAVLNAGLAGATSTVDTQVVRITSDAFGAGSSIEVTGGTGAAAFSFPAGACTGTDATSVLAIVNRVPEPDERRVPLDANIVFDIVDTDGTAPLATDLSVLVNGVTAYDGGAGGFQPGFSGSTNNPDAATLHFVIDPAVDFATDTSVDVQVIVGALDETWTFFPADLVPPLIADVVAQDKKRVRVTFNEVVKQTSASDVDDALNPANYFFTRTTRPAVNVVAVSALPISDTVVDVLTDIEMTFGAGYQLLVANVVDDEGNAFLAPANAFLFDAFVPPFPQGRRFLLAEMVPSINIAEDSTQELRLFLGMLQEVVNLLLCEIDRWTDIFDIDRAPEDFIEAILFDQGNPFGRFALSETDKRRLASVIVGIYKLKGTEPGLVDVVRFFLGFDVTVRVFNGLGWTLTKVGADPAVGDKLNKVTEDSNQPAILGPGPAGIYSFCIETPVDLTREQAEGIIFLADYMKPAHTHLTCIQQPNDPDFDLSGLAVPVFGSAGVFVDHLELGKSKLGGGAGKPGTWILHGA